MANPQQYHLWTDASVASGVPLNVGAPPLPPTRPRWRRVLRFVGSTIVVGVVVSGFAWAISYLSDQPLRAALALCQDAIRERFPAGVSLTNVAAHQSAEGYLVTGNARPLEKSQPEVFSCLVVNDRVTSVRLGS